MGVDTADTFGEVSKLAHARSGVPDLYLLTGDLSQDESESSYERLSEQIKDFQAPAYFLPGNHDARDAMSKAFLRSGAPLKPDRRVVVGDWQLILLDTQVEGEIGGALSQQELERLDAQLSEHGDKFALVALHHHPLPIDCWWIDRIGLENGGEFLQVLDRHSQVRLVVWGHIHQEFESMRNGVRLLGTPSTCVQFKPRADEFAVDAIPPGYRWLKLNPDGTTDTGVVRSDRVAPGLDRASAGY